MDGMEMGTRTWRPRQGWGGDSPGDAVTLSSPLQGEPGIAGFKGEQGPKGETVSAGGHPEPPARIQP